MTTHAIPRIPEWTIADRIRKARTSANLDLRELGDLLGLSHSAAVQNLLGHADLSSMRHYIARASIAEIAQAVEARFGDG